jgi:hypothetical protein
MFTEMEDWKTGWYGISIGLNSQEIDGLIELLQMIKGDPEQHFHLSSDFEGNGGVGDIEIYLKEENQKDNMALLSKAIEPGEEF